MKKIQLFLLVLITLVVLASCGESKHIHSYGSWEVIQEPTCTEQGLKERVCECGNIDSQTIPALGHTAGKPVAEEEKPATCTEAGGYYSVSYCTLCGERLTPVWKTTPALGHDAGEPVAENRIEPTCIEPGGYYSVSYCTLCGEKLSSDWNVIMPLGHTAGIPVTENIKESSCTEDGGFDTVTYCTVCSSETSRAKTKTPATGHTPGEEQFEVITQPSCEETGSGTSVVYCTVCGQEISNKTVVIPAAGHNYVSGACTVCGEPQPSEGLVFRRNGDGTTCTLTGIGTCTDSVVIIPKRSPLGEKVTVIDRDAIAFNGFVTEIVIPSTVKTIRSGAFSVCTVLTKVVIPEGVTSIDSSAFEFCPELKSLEVPASVTVIAGGLLSHCGSVESLTVAEGNSVYYSKDNCIIDRNGTLVAGIRTSVIPDDGSVKKIGDGAFLGCVEAYIYLTGPTSYMCQISGGDLNGDSFTEIVIPKGVLSIGRSAFEECNSLRTVTICEGVTSIDVSAFAWCNNISDLYLPASVKIINVSAFHGINTVYYAGTEEQWKAITIGAGNEALASATIVYNSSY